MGQNDHEKECLTKGETSGNNTQDKERHIVETQLSGQNRVGLGKDDEREGERGREIGRGRKREGERESSLKRTDVVCLPKSHAGMR